MVDTYSNSHEVDEELIGSVHSGSFTVTSGDCLACTSSDSGFVCDQSIIPPASSTEDNINFSDDVNLHHLMNLKLVLQLLSFDPIFHNMRNFQALSLSWNQLKILNILGNCVASSINIEGLVFCAENLLQKMIPSVAEPPRSLIKYY